jgi:nitroreductase
MDTLTAIHTRRSIRRYLDKPISEELVEKLLATAMQSPSARNQQPWQFVVIDDRALLAEIPTFMPNAAMAAKAPLAILVCGDLELEKSEGYWVVDCAAATENMLLAAHALGLGACWCGVYPREHRMEGLRQRIGLPKNVIAHSLVVIGHPAEQVGAEDRYRADRVHRNRWTT